MVVATANRIPRSPASPPVLQATGLSKRFGAVQANSDIDLTLHAGEIHSLLGENGAGKTTLLNILTGVLQPDSGEFAIAGRRVHLSSPASAIANGIGAVFQHLSLASNLTIRENLLLGSSEFLLSAGKADPQLQASLDALDLTDQADTPVRYLSLGSRQRGEIAKALYRNARVLLLDEPTSTLSPGETEALFAILARLRQQGVAIVLVTHKLNEALHITDRVTVLRQGVVQGEISLSSGDRLDSGLQRDILNMMFEGRSETATVASQPHQGGERILALRNVSARNDLGSVALADVSFDLSQGEVLGIAGVDGNGQRELAEVIAGQRELSSGEILLDGVSMANRGVRGALQAGVGYITDDRLGEGIVADASVAENMIIKEIARQPFWKNFWYDRGETERTATAQIAEFDVRADGMDSPASSLSGGNLQKLLLARELASKPRVLVINKPTAGLDARTAQSILRTLRKAADAGMAIILISPEIDDLLAVSNRIGVLYGGRLQAILPRQEIDPAAIGRFMVGGAA